MGTEQQVANPKAISIMRMAFDLLPSSTAAWNCGQSGTRDVVIKVCMPRARRWAKTNSAARQRAVTFGTSTVYNLETQYLVLS